MSRQEYQRSYNQSERGRKCKQRYRKSAKGKATDRAYKQQHPEETAAIHRRYAESDHGKEVISNYLASDARRQAVQRYEQSPKGKAQRRAKEKRRRQRYPEKTRARNAANYAIKAGYLIPQPCERCGATPTEAHHPDYSKPLEVVWLCQPCHRQAERERPS